MAKKKFLEDEDVDLEMDFNPSISAAKLPTDISEGKKPLFNYMEIPVDQIIEYQNKQESDFHAYSEEKFNALVESIKECGVLEAITVRPLTTGKYELLAGEHRWKATIAAGLKTVPAHVLKDISDDTASDYFTLTNLIRRDLTIVDRVNGWWLWAQNNKRQGFRSDLFEVVEQTTDKPLPIGESQIKRYVKIHDLIPQLMAMLDDSTIGLSLSAAYQLSFLTPEQQAEIASFKAKVSEPNAIELKRMSLNNEWSKEKAAKVICGVVKKDNIINFSPLVKSVKKIAKKKLKPELYEQADQIFAEALELYFEKHPEAKL